MLPRLLGKCNMAAFNASLAYGTIQVIYSVLMGLRGDFTNAIAKPSILTMTLCIHAEVIATLRRSSELILRKVDR